MSTVDLTNHSGSPGISQWFTPSDYRTCLRCGVLRRVHTNRPPTDLCRDCRAVEHDTGRLQPEPIEGGTWTRHGGVWRWTAEPEPLSDEDREWCERQAEMGFWDTWSRQARTADNPPLQAEAERRARHLSTSSVDMGLPETRERMFDSNNQSEGVA
jgi:hypothetical protein